MTVINGYKLVCEWCGKESESLWGISDPEEYLLRRECEDNYIPIMTIGTSSNFYNNCETDVKKVYLPEDWRNKKLRREITEDREEAWTYKYEPSSLFFFPDKKVRTLKPLNSRYEEKYIYFCCQDHKDVYERLKKNQEQNWE